MSKPEAVKAAVEAGKTKVVGDLVQEALNAGHKANEILAVMIDAMEVVRQVFWGPFVRKCLLPEKPCRRERSFEAELAGEGAPALGKCIIGTVAGDLTISAKILLL